MAKKLKAGIIGLGVGEQHIFGYESTGLCEVTTLCDFDNNKLSEVNKRHPEKNFTDSADDVLEDKSIEIISIASFDNYHFEQILKAVKADKHVFVEKPLCMSEEEAVSIRKALNEKPQIKMSSNLILRKCPRFIKLKQDLKSGVYGDIYNIEGDYLYGRLHKLIDGWRGDLDFYSIVYGGGVHIIDLMMWLIDEKIISVSAYGNNICSNNTKFKHNDMVTAVLRFESGIVGRMSCNFGCVRPHFHDVRVYGTEASFINDSPDGRFYKSREKDYVPESVREEYPGYHKGDLIKSFVKSISDDSQPEVSAEDVFAGMSVCFAIEKSVQTGNAVQVNYI